MAEFFENLSQELANGDTLNALRRGVKGEPDAALLNLPTDREEPGEIAVGAQRDVWPRAVFIAPASVLMLVREYQMLRSLVTELLDIMEQKKLHI